EVREHTVRIVKDLVARYDIDAIHMDDYFYPYRISGKEFPDQKTFEQFGNGLTKDNWRRSNCDSIIVQLQRAIRATN
ncbi:family 10 glycosylhydrolase, partial [Shewanella algae]|uniref:family 10 glycosylhydrolase n=1 Tax=Shewanella algae TaxID=38313 RepID=UPI00313F0E82